MPRCFASVAASSLLCWLEIDEGKLIPITFSLPNASTAIAAVIVGFALLAIDNMGWQYQALVFAALTVISIVAWRSYARTRPLPSDDSTLNRRAEQLTGRLVTLKDPIVDGRGRIVIDGVAWTVEGEDMDSGCGIRVIGVAGAILKIERT